MIITSLRTYEKDHTDGRVFIDGKFFGHSLEDAGRPNGVKIYAETCIPEGTYKVSISYSNRFKRDMLILYNIDDDHSIDRVGVRFTGIRAHGGNNIEHTAGCIIVAKKSNKKGVIWSSLESELLKAVRSPYIEKKEILWVFAGDV